MSVTKKIKMSPGNPTPSDYIIDTSKYDGNPEGNIFVYTHTLRIDGNLEVVGNTANIQAFDTTKQIFQINADRDLLMSLNVNNSYNYAYSCLIR